MKQKYNFKKTEKIEDNIYAIAIRKIFGNPISKVLIKHTNIKPNHVTIAGFICAIVGAFFLALGGHVNQIIGAVFALLFVVLDVVDGNIARVKNLTSKFGRWLDGMVGFISLPLLTFSLAFGINTKLGLTLGSLAMIAFPMQFLIVHFYKLSIIKMSKSIRIGISKKADFLTRIYGDTLFYVILLICTLINQPIVVLWIFAIGGNLFWILTAAYLTALQYNGR